ncbi:Haloacid dehalogenase-like hydrolase (HAD) superfamily protein [Striga hermonthica]|uniref:Haloacid dehalogenase-like hydrolase (HAD) superfamily protein n=1 Tax=Striga hermonthica TaxID=68872 RepID=A0A9N7MHK4_STRHE|nr:Haloacid dehalogenase-like hydrolase (HAD) superfamily protein [Striga hermonthica]
MVFQRSVSLLSKLQSCSDGFHGNSFCWHNTSDTHSSAVDATCVNDCVVYRKFELALAMTSWKIRAEKLLEGGITPSLGITCVAFFVFKQGDCRPFRKLVVSEATGCDNANYFEEVYEYYANGDSWNLPEGAYETLLCLKDSGVKLAVVSNFDYRLRKLLRDLNILHLVKGDEAHRSYKVKPSVENPSVQFGGSTAPLPPVEPSPNSMVLVSTLSTELKK